MGREKEKTVEKQPVVAEPKVESETEQEVEDRGKRR